MISPKTIHPLIVVSSKTGNTRIVGHAIADAYADGVLYTPQNAPADLNAFNPVILGFWCDRGMVPEDMQAFAQKLENKDIACFTTMGADTNDPKTRAWVDKAAHELSAKGNANSLQATFVCRGRIDPELFDRMTKMYGGITPEREARRKAAETHPDRLDCLAAVDSMKKLFE